MIYALFCTHEACKFDDGNQIVLLCPKIEFQLTFVVPFSIAVNNDKVEKIPQAELVEKNADVYQCYSFLPDDVLIKTFHYLTLKEVAQKLRLVNTHFDQVCVAFVSILKFYLCVSALRKGPDISERVRSLSRVF